MHLRKIRCVAVLVLFPIRSFIHSTEIRCFGCASCVTTVAACSFQDALYDYLKERNIDDDLAAFICMYADQKEQNEYTNWLAEVANFVK